MDVLYKGVTICDLKYSVNNSIFYYNVITNAGLSKVYKYTKEQHEEIEQLKEQAEINFNNYCINKHNY